MKDTIHFDAPEFYEQDSIILTAQGPHGKFHIVSEGTRSVSFTLIGGTVRDVRSADSFRSNFPDGNLPDASADFVWHNNGWFAVYDDYAEFSETYGEPMMSLAEAVTYALELAYGEL
jgi:hypothetical protein